MTAGLLLFGVAGCSWLLGVSDDPVVSIESLGPDAGDDADDAAGDAAEDAPEDVEVE